MTLALRLLILIDLWCSVFCLVLLVELLVFLGGWLVCFFSDAEQEPSDLGSRFGFSDCTLVAASQT